MKTFYEWDADWCAAVQRELDPFLEQAKANRKPRTPEEEAEKLRAFLAEPVDPEVEEMVDYLGVDLLPEEMARIEERLENDAEYRQRMAPLIWMWEAPVSLTPPSERGEPEPPKPPVRDTGEVIEMVPKKIARRRLWLIAFFAVVLPVSVVLGGVAMVQYQARQSFGLGAPDPKERAEGRAPTNMIAHPLRYETGPNDSQIVQAGNGIEILLAPSSRVTVSGGGIAKAFAALDGEASVTIGGGSSMYLLSTPAGLIPLMSGRYAIRALPHSTETLITIVSGKVVSAVGASISEGFVSVSGTNIKRVTDGGNHPTFKP